MIITLNREVHLQYWREALSPDLQQMMDELNRTSSSPWFVRFRCSMQRLHWWYWRKTLVTEYQILKHLGGDQFDAMVDGQWVSRALVIQFISDLTEGLKAVKVERRLPSV